MAKSPKISNAFNPGRQLNAASRKSLECLLSQNEETFRTKKNCLYKGV